MRTSDALLLAAALLVAGCDKGRGDNTAIDRAAADQAASADRIACARGDAPLSRTCTVERQTGDKGLVLTIRHPDGAFRRLLVTTDGRGVIAADGAEPAHVTVVDGGSIDVRLGTNHYVLPATVKRR